jgi:hypothetical protein
MPRSMLLLCAAAVGLAACGSNEAANTAADNAANTAAANTANSADTTNAADSGGPGKAYGKAKGKGQSGAAGGAQGQAVAVEFSGCTRLVKVSKPAGCLVVKSGSATYDIDSAQPRPNADAAIAGTGVYDPNTQGICMAGKPLTGVKWHYTRALCTRGKDGERPGKRKG